MAQIVDYTTLAAALASWQESAIDADEVIGLAEAEFKLLLGPNFAIETVVTLAFTSGVATLPTGFSRIVSLTHATYGDVPVRTMAQLQAYLASGAVGATPAIVAVSGNSIYTAPLYTGNLTLVYEGQLAGLTSTNATNWLILNAPQAYLSMGLSMIKAKNEDFQGAAVYRQQAEATINDLGIQSMVGQYGRASLVIAGSTP